MITMERFCHYKGIQDKVNTDCCEVESHNKDVNRRKYILSPVVVAVGSFATKIFIAFDLLPVSVGF